MFNFFYVLNKGSRIKTAVNYQSVRWRRPRKPFWLGIAKSKMFVVKEPKITRSNEEKFAIEKLNRQYNTSINSLLEFVKNKNPLFKSMEYNSEESVAHEKLEIAVEKSLKKNEEWNEYSALLREERWKQSLIKEQEKARNKLQMVQEQEEKNLKEIEEIVKIEKIKSASYITIENLDEAIENCLNNVVDYNYAIDLKGKKYIGSDSLPSSREKLGISVLKKEIETENTANST